MVMVMVMTMAMACPAAKDDVGVQPWQTTRLLSIRPSANAKTDFSMSPTRPERTDLRFNSFQDTMPPLHGGGRLTLGQGLDKEVIAPAFIHNTIPRGTNQSRDRTRPTQTIKHERD